jgi:hypothetical protein
MDLHISKTEGFFSRTAWLETLALTFLFPAIGYQIDVSDPFYLNTQFPWLIFLSILISLRYGFLFGMISIALLIALFLLCLHFNWVTTPSVIPSEMLVGILLTTVITAEFHDIWRRKLQPLQYKHQYLQLRMDEFSRAYYLLKESHALLEQQIATSKSLHTWLRELQNQILALANHGGEPLEDIGDQVLDLFVNYGSIQTASIHSVSKNHKINVNPVTRLGNPPPFRPTHPLIVEALQTGQVTSFQRESEAREYEILVVVPLVDVFNKIWGIVVVNEIPLFALQENTLDRFALLGGYVGDLIQRRAERNTIKDSVKKEFELELLRAWKEAKSIKMTATVILFIFDQVESHNRIISEFRSQLRGFDKVWSIRDDIQGRSIIINLLPSMDKDNLQDFLARFYPLESNNWNTSIESEAGERKVILPVGLTIYSWVLNEKTLSIRPILSKVAEFCPPDNNFAIDTEASGVGINF